MLLLFTYFVKESLPCPAALVQNELLPEQEKTASLEGEAVTPFCILGCTHRRKTPYYAVPATTKYVL